MTEPTTVVKIGTEFQVNSQIAGSQWYPTVTGLSNGGFVVTWQDGLAGSNSGSGTLGDSSGSSIKAQIYAADGGKVGGEFLVNTQTNGSQASPVITSLSNGGFIVSWQDQSSTSGDIKAQIYSANGAPVGGEFLINSVTANNQNTPTITGLPNGGFVVAWTSQGNSGADVKAQVYSENGTKVGSEFLVNSSNAFDQERASITTLANGDFVVTWNDDRTGDWEVRGQVFHPTASGATKVGSEFTVDTAYYNNRMVAGVTGLADGNFVVSFEDFGGDVRAQVFTATGTKVGAEFLVNTNTSGNQGFSSITALTNGGFVVAWMDEGSPADGSGSAIKAQVYDANGNKIGGEYIVNAQVDSVQYYPTVSALANGGFVITWQDFSQKLGDNSSYGIVAQIFNLSNAPAAPSIVSITDDVSPNTGALADGASTNDTNLTVRIATGSNFAGDVVQLFDGQTALGTAVTLTIADIARGYIDLQTGPLSDATHAITAKVTDTTGLQSGAATAIDVTVDTVAPAVAVTGVVLDDGNLPTMTVNGTAEAGLLVSVYDGASLVGTVTAGNDGSWSLSGVTLTEGANNLTAKATDAAGNTGTSAEFAAPTLVSTGTIAVYSSTTTAMGYVVLGDGTLDVASGGNVSGQITIGNGGVVDILTGGTAQHTDVLSGGVQFDYGTADDTVVAAGGVQHVYFGGNATGTTVAAGGFQDVYWNSTVIDTTLSGQQQVLEGGTAIDTVIEDGGYQYLGEGGAADGTVINTGGLQYVDVGATATDTVINGGFQFVGGTGIGTSGGGDSQVDGVATGVTVQNGGAQHVYGGRAIATSVAAGGFQDVYFGTVTDTSLSGQQQVLAGSVAHQTVIESGGNQYIGTGGSATVTTVNAGGLQYVDVGASAASTTINGGFAWVAGTASGVTVNSGELDVVGTASNTHLAGGVERVLAGGVQNGVDFAGSAATLSLDAPSSLTGTVSNFEVGDSIDLLNTSVSSFTFDGTTLTLATNSGNYAWQFAGVQSGTELNVADDGHGGTAISLSLLVQQSASIVPDSGIESSFAAPATTQDHTTLASVQG